MQKHASKPLGLRGGRRRATDQWAGSPTGQARVGPRGCLVQITTTSTYKRVVKVRVAQSCPTLRDPLNHTWNPPGQNTGVGSLSLLLESNAGLLHCRQILYQLSHKGSPRILEWAANPFSSGSSQPTNWTRVSCIADGFLKSWVTREALVSRLYSNIK